MSPTTTATKTAPQRTLPASIIFSPKELRHYRRFRRQTTQLETSELGHLPTATEYTDFLAWRSQKRDSNSLDALCFEPCPIASEFAIHLDPIRAPKRESGICATSCKHVLHPGTPQPISNLEKCPVCVITTHLSYMTLLTHALHESGGLFRPRTNSPSLHDTVFQAWYCGKLDLVQVVYQFEEWAQSEKEWALLNPGACVKGKRSAGQALELYWAGISGSNSSTAAVGCEEMKEKDRRSVSFGDDTSFEQGRDPAYFWKKSPRYEVGKYECAVEDEVQESESESDQDNGEKEGTEDYDMESGKSEDEESSEEDLDEDEEDEEWEEVDGADFIVFGD